MPGDSKKGDLGVIEDAAKQIGTAVAALEYRITTPLQNELQFNGQAQAALNAFVSPSGKGVKCINSEIDLGLRSVWCSLDLLVAALDEARQEIAQLQVEMKELEQKNKLLQEQNTQISAALRNQQGQTVSATGSDPSAWPKVSRKRGNGRSTHP